MYFVTYKELDFYREYEDYVEEDKFKEFENLEDALKFIEENYSLMFGIRDVRLWKPEEIFYKTTISVTVNN